MSTPLTRDMLSQLQGAPLANISRQLGLPEDQAEDAISAALPLLVGALGRNASQPQGAEALFGALQRDHAGTDLGGLLGAVLGGGGQGAGILGHVLGGQQGNAVRGLGAATGLDNDRMGQLLKMLAPLVMAYLAKRMFSSTPAPAGTSPLQPTPASLGTALGEESQRIRQDSLGGGLLGAVLDQDGDGDLDVNDLMRLGSSIFGGR
ncbi:DUF937 domain-containing protein [Lysobacter sp. SG-8]|uniref:DUF937 domain-containing protein n=1 Tax=Marilutibacter penaei TaxID=2759900 RepID=A0A7W3U2E5_9GAMM|nr:DUF937 domain-containing protein [Lysobacter penaei]MBB1087380.1 DUF937 domain-containing protein [Lysobacter penaei]